MANLDSIRLWCRRGAIVVSACSAVLTAYFGMNLSSSMILGITIAAGLVVLSLTSDYIPVFIADAYKNRNWATLGYVGAVGVFCIGFNIVSNLGAVGWQRDAEITKAHLQNVRHDDVRETVTDKKATLELLQKRLVELQAQNAWSASVTADGMRERLASAQKAIELETARGGCKTRCLALMRQRDELADRIKTAEAIEDLPKQIAAAKRALETVREKSTETPKAVAAAASQAEFFASLVRFDLTPSVDAKTWTDRGLATLTALIFVFLPGVLNLIGWRDGGSRAPQQPSRSPLAPSPGLSVVGAGSTRTGLLTTAAA